MSDAESNALPSKPRSASQIESWSSEFDVVVVGLGVAGGAAAIEARRAGASVLVLEQQTRGGGAVALLPKGCNMININTEAYHTGY